MILKMERKSAQTEIVKRKLKSKLENGDAVYMNSGLL